MQNARTEEDFVILLKSNDAIHFRHLYDAYAGALFRVLLKYVTNDTVAEDLLQNVFIKIWKSSAQYSPARGRMYTWFLNIARNEAIDYLRSKASGTSLFYALTPIPLDLSDTCSEQEFTSRSDIGILMRVLGKKEQNLLELVKMGYTFKQISIMMNMPEGTVKTKIRASYRKLRADFQGYRV